MKKISVSFFNPFEKCSFNELPISRQAFSRAGNLGNVSYTINDINAVWHVVGTWIENIDDLLGNKILYLQQEPPEIRLPSKDILDKCTLALTFFNFEHKIPQILAPPALQWTYDISAKSIKGKGHVYEKVNNNYLEEMLFTPIPEKKKKCSIVLSAKQMIEGHKKRIIFAEELKRKFKNEIDIFGFGFKPIDNKKDAIDPSYYSIALENSTINNWWTEKIADVFLGYTCPIYYGCSNITDFFDKSSLIEIDINNIEHSLSIIEKAIENTQIINMSNIIEARRSILLDFNMLSLIATAINRFEKI